MVMKDGSDPILRADPTTANKIGYLGSSIIDNFDETFESRISKFLLHYVLLSNR